MHLTGETTNAPTTTEREAINITSEAKGALNRILFHPQMRGVGFSEFILRAVRVAEEELQAHDQYIERRRSGVRALTEREMTDAEADAFLAKLDAERGEE